MAQQNNFPLEELKDGLRDIQRCLERAESDFSKEEKLADSIQQAKSAAENLEKKISSNQ